MKSIVLGLLLATLSLGASAEDCPLKGTWKSDKKKTLPHLYAVKNLRPSARTQISSMLGKIEVEYPNCSEFVARFEDEVTRGSFEIISQKGNVIAARVEGIPGVSHITLEDDCYYAISEVFRMKEYYCRI